ncbi:SDR family NAD(P)-dependent oxidoreductase [Cupriavidus sp. 8B]
MKTFLSIGAGPGIGFATAERFAREGFRVVLGARNMERTLELTTRLRAQGYEAEARKVDASDAANIAALIAEVEALHGTLDVLHYNAANIRQATLAEQPIDTFASDLAVNVGGAMAAAKTVMPKMAARQSGTILLTGGFFGITPNQDYLSLSLGKAGIRALALGLFEPSKARGVHVATVTVAAFVKPGSEEAKGIAEAFWKLHSQPKESWVAEVTYSR